MKFESKIKNQQQTRAVTQVAARVDNRTSSNTSGSTGSQSIRPKLNILLYGFPQLHAEGMRCVLSDMDYEVQVFVNNKKHANNNEANSKQIDLILVHFGLSNSDSASFDELVRDVFRQFRSVPTLVIFDAKVAAQTQRLLALGARGVLPNHSSVATLLLSIKAVMRGTIVNPNSYVNHHYATTSTNSNYRNRFIFDTTGSEREKRSHGSGVARSIKLTPRQLQVLTSLSEGKPNKIIARELDVSENTIKAHLKSVFRILGARNRTEAVSQANRYNLMI